MSTFETRLEEKLIRVVEARAADAPPVHPRRRRRQAIRIGAIAAVAAGVITVPTLLSGGTAPAYAVAENADGSLTITVNEIKDPATLEAKLRSHGVRSKVTIGQRCGTPDTAAHFRTEPHQDGQRSGMDKETGNLVEVHDRNFRVDPIAIPAGATIAIGFAQFDSDRVPFAVSIALVPAAQKLTCVPWP
ncbi:hypothetical protein ACIBH1_12030 [Nonomuraea sp. NPDC050663]|uniref:hypothetical protein n=1 Tax=Nonomuraea sp. NPDC050663 TaxID=3364370 RepID=UPI003790CA26